MAIITRLQGGLGNQLFQYATARYLSFFKNIPLLMDDQWFKQCYADVTPRPLLLRDLMVDGKFITFTKVLKRPNRLTRIAQKYLPINPYRYQEKNEYRFDPAISRIVLNSNQDLYLMGYWQSFKYFHHVRDLLLQEIKPNFLLSKTYEMYFEQISKQSNATMVHIRRGDYVNLHSAAKVHNLLDLNYYFEAMRSMSAQLPLHQRPHFFIFSDEIAWAEEFLPKHYPITFIKNSESERTVVEDLQLMAACQNHIIANSSLSWWGAWLCQKPNQKVICPSRWVNREGLSYDDLIPSAWQRIHV